MSFWIESKDKTGRRYLWGIDVEPTVVVALVGLLAAIIVPELLRRPLRVATGAGFLMLLGFGLFIAAKICLYRRGIWRSWGSALMSRPNKYAYRAGYFLMVIGSVLLMATSAASRGG